MKFAKWSTYLLLMALVLSLFTSAPSNAAWVQMGASSGAKWGSPIGGGPFTKNCPSGYVVTGVAVANSESFGYTEGFAFTCTQVDSSGELGVATSTIIQVTNRPSGSSSVCPTGYALVGVRILLRQDPNNNAVFYVNDLGARCAKFTDRAQLIDVGMARNVKLGPNNEYQDRDSSCSSGFVTGFEGRSGAGLDYNGVLCSTFQVEEEVKQSPSYIKVKESPKISQSTDAVTCLAGEYTFMRFGSIEEKSVITERTFQMIQDQSVIATITTSEAKGSFSKVTTSGEYSCTEQVRQENSLAISNSKSRIQEAKAIAVLYRESLRKNSLFRVQMDAASREDYLSARTTVAEEAKKSRLELSARSRSDFYPSLQAITATYRERLAELRVQYQTNLSKHLSDLQSANEKSARSYYQALEDAGILILITKSS